MKVIEALLAERDQYDGDARRDLRRLWRAFLAPFRRRLVMALAATFCCGTYIYGFALSWRYLIDHALLPPETSAPIPMAAREHAVWVFFFVNLTIWSVYLSALLIQGRILHRTAQSVVLALRKQLHEKLQVLHIGFYDRTPTGRIMSRLLDDITVIQASTTSYFVTLISSLAQLAVGIVVLFLLQWQVSLVLLAVLPAYALTYKVFRPLIRKTSMALSRQNANMYSLVAERISGIRVVKAFGREQTEVKSFARLMHDFMRMAMRLLTYNQGLGITAGLISTLATVGLIYACILRMRAGHMTFGDLVAFAIAVPGTIAPVASLTAFGSQLQSTLVSLGRVFGLLDVSEGVPPGQVHLSGIKGDIHIENVTFSYPEQSTQALREVDFNIDAGEHIALMGPSGAGKSTVFVLLLRFYDPDEGTVRIDNIDLKDADPASVRRHVCMVQQEPTIFSGTIAENIRYGVLDAHADQIITAAKQAELHEFIMSMPSKYETEVGESGVTLSGGQKQRTALATALLTNPEVLLLDDTTSALDGVTEARVRATLRKVLDGRTSLIITQRIATARTCDRIIVLEDGRVSQIGTHDELMRQRGFYLAVAKKQETG